MKKIKVTGLELETKKGQKVILTLDEAKELHEQLDELFGAKSNYNYTSPWIWFTPNSRPYYYNNTPPQYTYTITSSTNANNYVFTSNNTGMKLNYLSQ